MSHFNTQNEDQYGGMAAFGSLPPVSSEEEARHQTKFNCVKMEDKQSALLDNLNSHTNKHKVSPSTKVQSLVVPNKSPKSNQKKPSNFEVFLSKALSIPSFQDKPESVGDEQSSPNQNQNVDVYCQDFNENDHEGEGQSFKSTNLENSLDGTNAENSLDSTNAENSLDGTDAENSHVSEFCTLPFDQVIKRYCARYEEENIDPQNPFEIRSMYLNQFLSPFPTIEISNKRITKIFDHHDISFSKEMKNRLDALNFNKLSRMQSFMWPSFWKLYNMICIGASNTGKSFGYLIPLLSNLYTKELYKGSPAGYGPYALIICRTWKGVERLEEQLTTILGSSFNRFRILTLYEGKYAKSDNKKVFLDNGYYIIISTPEMFLKEAFGEERFCHVFNRCSHLILEDADELFRFSPEPTKAILAHYYKFCEHRKSNLPMQFVITSKHWLPLYSKFIDCYMKDNVELCFSSYFEVALYYNVNIDFKLTTREDLMAQIVELLKVKGRRVICVKDINMCLALQRELKKYNILTAVAHEEIGIEDGFYEKMEDFKRFKNQIMIVSDVILLSTNISNVDILIHYNIPSKPDTFENRFMLIHDNMKNGSAKSYVCLTPQDGRFVLNISRALRRIGREIPQPLAELKESYLKATRSNKQLCHFFKALGDCIDNKCIYRHYISEALDRPSSEFKINQDIKFSITHYVNCINYFIRPVGWDKKADELAKSLSEHFNLSCKSLSSNPIKPEVDSIYIVMLHETLFRAKVVKLAANNQVLVLDIDRGSPHTVPDCDLYELPSHLAEVDPFTIEAYVSTVKPLTSCYEWTPEADRYIKECIGYKQLEGKVQLCLGSTLWLSPVLYREWNDSFKKFLIKLNIKSELIRNELAKSNPEHIDILRKYCPGTLDLKIEAHQINYQHAFLQPDDFNIVHLGLVARLDLLFFTLEKNTKLVENLQQQIVKLIESGYNKPLHIYSPDMPALAKYSADNKWYRVRIKKEVSAHEVEIFFVDFGDLATIEKSSLLAIPDKLLSVLPFQAIECSLYGIEFDNPMHQEAIEYFYELSIDSNNFFKKLLVKPMEVLKKGEDSAGKHYKVMFYAENKELNFFCLARDFIRWNIGNCAEEVFQMEPEFITPPKLEADNDQEIDSEEDNINLPNELPPNIPSPDQSVKQKIRNSPQKKKQRSNKSQVAPLPQINVDVSKRVQVLWSQSKMNIVLELQVETTSKSIFEIEVQKDSFLYRSTSKLLFLELYSTVDSTKTRVDVKETYIRVTLTRTSKTPWKRLTKSNLKDPFIKPNLMHLDDTEEGEELPINYSRSFYQLASSLEESLRNMSQSSDSEDENCGPKKRSGIESDLDFNPYEF